MAEKQTKRKSILMRNIKIFILLPLILLALCGINCPAWALNLPYITKSKIRVSIPPGQKTYGDITVENPTTEERSMRLYLEDWRYITDGDGSKEFLPASTLKQSAASWITFSPAFFKVPPFGKQRISYSIKVPPDAAGGYYAALFFETVIADALPKEDRNVGANLNLTVRIASLFYIEPEGTIKRTAEVSNLHLERDKSTKNLSLRLNFENTGNVDITAGGTYHIMDKKGMVYARGEFNTVYTLAKEKSKLTATWKEPIPKGIYDLILTLDFGKALQEAGLNKGQALIKEAEIELDSEGNIVRVGELK